MSDFYVGYLPKAPAALARFLRGVILALFALTAAAALTLVFSQHPFAKSYFEYGTVRGFEGVVAMQPYPALLVTRPGQTTVEEQYSRYLLVAPGKYGAAQLMEVFRDKRVHLRGQLIYRDGRSISGGPMVEVVPDSIVALPAPPASPEATRDLGPVTATGEIVDSKCYLGVMNPGQGKVHRDCAARCLSGGIPPIFVASHIDTTGNASERSAQYLLVGPDGAALGNDALREFVAEPITLHAELLQRGDSQLLQIDPAKLHHGVD